MIYISIYITFDFVNSLLLLELPPCGQVQVMKTSVMLALVSRALIRNRDGESLSFLAFLYVSFLLKNMLLENYLLNNIIC